MNKTEMERNNGTERETNSVKGADGGNVTEGEENNGTETGGSNNTGLERGDA